MDWDEAKNMAVYRQSDLAKLCCPMYFKHVDELRSKVRHYHLLRGSAKQSVKDGLSSVWQPGNFNTSQLRNLSSYNDELFMFNNVGETNTFIKFG